jgi:hypothetical protein
MVSTRLGKTRRNLRQFLLTLLDFMFEGGQNHEVWLRVCPLRSSASMSAQNPGDVSGDENLEGCSVIRLE